MDIANFSRKIYTLSSASAQRFALPALGRAAGRRPTGKMIRRRKRLGISPESPASGARFVGHGLEGSPTVDVNRHAHNKPF